MHRYSVHAGTFGPRGRAAFTGRRAGYHQTAMSIEAGLERLKELPRGAVVSIGNFDGVHRGHQAILALARRLAKSESTPGVAVITFEPHPAAVLRPTHAPARLTTASLKLDLLQSYGVDYLLVLEPTPAMLAISAEDFYSALRDGIRPAHLVEGPTFNFGRDRAGTIERLTEWTARDRIPLHVVDEVEARLCDQSLVRVNSSIIRWLLRHGRVRDAGRCLGRPYLLEGQVVRGHQRGRTIGVRTANLQCGGQLIPADGVYAGRCTVDGRRYPAAVSIGAMPTFGDDAARQVEAHLIGFDGDLYGRTLRVELIDWLRDQIKYPTLELLKARLAKDLANVAEVAAAADSADAAIANDPPIGD